MSMLTERKDKVLECLLEVKDPEMPSVSIVDLGMISSVHLHDRGVTIYVLPTFTGCPALEIIRKNIKEKVGRLEEAGVVEVEYVYDPPWTSDRITDKGREELKKYGIAPPPEFLKESGIWEVDCPYCGSPYTMMENLFGPTACRSILYCKTCRNPFEAMKPILTNM
ncbi:1,2-phenylacetyl-CoA epoxidase subunit PaaD [Heyndrickxia acidicola]|uniref:Phenylacetate-CoA oxygenase subunit PaaJ n=1 Tax=Heyndrickxia acidicola TaxID=209389 RepID=A0ABU6MEW8_9BACI|nr:1,2-phenylacetyl-CoA epoxidase subunit PaaD [Heyndrickxia acidicola]MED1202983.1 phenylacetate-CoA oxygenase subunit PaaJ [Heyndrickxia acidicola]